jgi:hypothetical protein
LAKQIRELAKNEVFAAAMLAERGKVFSHIETLLSLFYKNLEPWRKVQANEITPYEETMKKWSGSSWNEEESKRHRTLIIQSHMNFVNELAQIFIEAIENKDSSKVREIADAIDLLKKEIKSQDPWRSKILMEKHLLISWKENRSIGQWAKILGWPQADADNGFPQLRRLLKELDAPLKPSRQISSK